MKSHYILPAMLLVASAAQAQDNLDAEITVQHEVVPEERAATRVRILPTVQLPTLNPGRLAAATSPSFGTITPFINTLEPAAYAGTLQKSPYKGYAVVDYGPIYNAGASAGYKFVDTQKVEANAYLQFNGQQYKTEHPDASYRGYGKVKLRNNSGAFGANTTWRAMDNGALTANVLYNFSDYNFPLPVLGDYGVPYQNPENCFVNNHQINLHMVDFNAAWRQQASKKISYGVTAGYGLTKFGRIAGAMTENEIKFGADVLWDYGRISHWALKVDYDNLITTAPDFGVYNKGNVRVKPAYALTLDHFMVKVGANAAIQTGNEAAATSPLITIYPELSLLWKPSSQFNIYYNLDGYTDLNSLRELYEWQPYMFPTMDAANFNPRGNYFSTSKILRMEGGLNLGPWKGASLNLFAKFATTDNSLMPGIAAGYWTERDMTGMLLGIDARYTFRNYLDLSARFAWNTSPDDDFERGYYTWRDHARYDLNVKATIRPIKPLSIFLGYHLRTNRAKIMLTEYVGYYTSQNLGNIYDLSAGLAYQLNKQWSVFINGQNLLNHTYYLGPAIPAQGINGMVGVSVKF